MGRFKTEASQKPVPLTHRVAADLFIWKESTSRLEPTAWIFVSRMHQGCLLMWPETVLQKIIQPAAFKAGITKHIGWHTFRHTYPTWLIANGEQLKVVQELMGHASSHFTLQIYSQVKLEPRGPAQLRLVEALLEEEPWISNTGSCCRGRPSTLISLKQDGSRKLVMLSCKLLILWWAQQDSNLRLPPCEGGTLPLSYAPDFGFPLT